MPREGFCGSDANLRTDVDVGSCIRGTGDAGADGVADAIDEGSLLLSQLDGSQRVGCLAALRDGNHHIVLRHHGVAITELRSVLHFAWDAAQALEELLANESGVPRGSACHDDDALCTEQLLAIINHGRQRHMIAFHIDSPSHTIHKALRLLEDFLQHEVFVAAFLYLAEVDVNGLNLQFLFLTEDAQHFQLFAHPYHRNVAVLQIDHFIRIVNDRTCI